MWLPFTDYSDREHFLKTQPQLLKMSFFKKTTNIRLKTVHHPQKIGKKKIVPGKGTEVGVGSPRVHKHMDTLAGSPGSLPVSGYQWTALW